MKKSLSAILLVAIILCSVVIVSCRTKNNEDDKANIFMGGAGEDFAPNQLFFELLDNNTYGVKMSSEFSIETLVIPSTYHGKPVTQILPQGFFGSSVKKVTIPSSIKKIGYLAFSYCASLEEVMIFDGTETIGHSAFQRCTSLTKVSIPNTLKEISISVFEDCYLLPWNQYDNAFYLGNSENPYLMLVSALSDAIKSVNIHKDTKFIGDKAFLGCSLLENVTIPENVVFISQHAFRDCTSLKSIVIPNTVKYMYGYVFSGCTSLESVTLPEKLDTAVFHEMFAGCKNLKSVVIPEGFTSLGSKIFKGCESLTEVTLPNSTEGVSEGIFTGCNSLKNINFKGTKAEWDALPKSDNWSEFESNIKVNFIG